MTRLRRRRPTQIVLGIDQSYSGFAVCALHSSGRHDMFFRSFEAKKSDGVIRLTEIAQWLHELFASLHADPVHVCMEGYAYASKFGREQAGELGAVVKLALLSELPMPVAFPTIVTPTQVKQFATSRSKGVKKSDIKMAVYKHWSQEFSNEDHADAYVLARIAEAVVATSSSPRNDASAPLPWSDGELTGYQREVVKKLRQHTEWQRSDDDDTEHQRQQRAAG